MKKPSWMLALGEVFRPVRAAGASKSYARGLFAANATYFVIVFTNWSISSSVMPQFLRYFLAGST